MLLLLIHQQEELVVCKYRNCSKKRTNRRIPQAAVQKDFPQLFEQLLNTMEDSNSCL